MKIYNLQCHSVFKIWYLVLLVIILNSCVCLRKTTDPIIITQKDTIYTTIIYKDTTVKITLPKDTVFSVDTIYISAENNLYIAPKSLTKGIISTTASIHNNKLYLSAYLNDSTFYYPIINAIRTTSTNKIQSTSIQPIKPYTPFQYLLFLIIIPVSLGFIVFATLHFLSRKSKS